MAEKKGLAIMLGFGKPKGEPKEETETKDTEVDGFDVAAEEAFAAIKADDAEAFKEAFKSAVEQKCRYLMNE